MHYSNLLVVGIVLVAMAAGGQESGPAVSAPKQVVIGGEPAVTLRRPPVTTDDKPQFVEVTGAARTRHGCLADQSLRSRQR